MTNGIRYYEKYVIVYEENANIYIYILEEQIDDLCGGFSEILHPFFSVPQYNFPETNIKKAYFILKNRAAAIYYQIPYRYSPPYQQSNTINLRKKMQNCYTVAKIQLNECHKV